MATSPITEIGTNLTGMRLARILNDNTLLLQKSLERLTSGLRIVSPGDDPGGLATSVRLNNQISRVDAAQTGIENVEDYVNSQSSLLEDVSESLSRMSELAVLSQSSTATASQRSSYQIEFQQLQVFLSDTGQKYFNGLRLFDASSMNVVIDEDGKTYTLNAINYNSSFVAGGIQDLFHGTIDISTTTTASAAVSTVSTAVANLGLMQARVSGHVQILDLYSGGLTEMSENLTAARDRILVADTATESAEFSRLDLLTQSGTTVIAQWNVLRANLLNLFQI